MYKLTFINMNFTCKTLSAIQSDNGNGFAIDTNRGRSNRAEQN